MASLEHRGQRWGGHGQATIVEASFWGHCVPGAGFWDNSYTRKTGKGHLSLGEPVCLDPGKQEGVLGQSMQAAVGRGLTVTSW